MSARVLVTGASGFLGQATVARLSKDGFVVRAAVHGDKHVAGAQEHVRLDISNRHQLEEACVDCNFLVHLVAIIKEKGDSTFEGVIAQGTRNVVEAAKLQGVRKIVYISALGTHPNASEKYFVAKWHAEEAIRNSGIQYVIFRPSSIVGPEDELINQFAGKVSAVPVSDASRMQPIYVGDVAEAISRAISLPTEGTFELGGREILTLYQMVEIAEKVRGKRAWHVRVPLGVARFVARAIFDPLLRLGLDMPAGSAAVDMLGKPNVCTPGELERTIDVFGLSPRPFVESV
jgi:NADH dehydrogenase